MSTQSVLNEVAQERERQINTYGWDDSLNSKNDWAAYVTTYAGRARDERIGEDFRRNMIKVAALAVAAIEACDREYPTQGGQ